MAHGWPLGSQIANQKKKNMVTLMYMMWVNFLMLSNLFRGFYQQGANKIDYKSQDIQIILGGVFLAITTWYADLGSGYVVPSACAKSGVDAMVK